MKVDSKDAFIKMMFDKQFSSVPNELDTELDLSYALTPKMVNGQLESTHYAHFNHETKNFFFSFVRTGTRTSNYTGAVTYTGVLPNNYDEILKKAKRKCKFVDWYTVEKDTYACYDCKNAEFEGYLGFVTIDSQGVIAQIRYINQDDWKLH